MFTLIIEYFINSGSVSINTNSVHLNLLKLHYLLPPILVFVSKIKRLHSKHESINPGKKVVILLKRCIQREWNLKEFCCFSTLPAVKKSTTEFTSKCKEKEFLVKSPKGIPTRDRHKCWQCRVLSSSLL